MIEKFQVNPSASQRAWANAIAVAKSYLAKLEAVGINAGPTTPAHALSAVNDGIDGVQASWAALCTSELVAPTPGTTLSHIGPAGGGNRTSPEATAEAMAAMRA